MKNNLDLQANVIDCVAYGDFPMSSFLLASKDFETLFNRPKPGSNIALRRTIDELIARKFIKAKRVKEDLTCSLTAKGGKFWEEYFQIDWSKYADLSILEDAFSEDHLIFSINTVGHNTCLKIVKEVSRNEQNPSLVAFKDFDWRWSSWKTFPIMFRLLLRCEQKDIQKMDFITHSVFSARKGWKQSFE